MFRNVPACSGMFHVPGFIDGLFYISFISVISPVKIDGFPRADLLAFYNILPHAGFAERRNASPPGAYLTFLLKVVESTSREKSAGGVSF